MTRCAFSARAVTDLEEIGDYIARNNPARAVSFVRELRQRCARIARRRSAAASGCNESTVSCAVRRSERWEDA